MRKFQVHLWVFIFLISLWGTGCHPAKEGEKDVQHDLSSMQKKGKLVVITDYNSTSYFIYRGTPMGFQYDLLQLLAKELDLELELRVSNDLAESIEKLQANECDLLAMNIIHTQSRKEDVAFVHPLGKTDQRLVQRKPEGWQRMASYNINKHLLQNPLELAGKTVHITNNDAFVDRLQHLSDEIGDAIQVQEVAYYDAEQLVSLVDKGEIDYTVCEQNTMQLYASFYPNLDASTALSFEQYYGWAVHKEASAFQEMLNNWLTDFTKTAHFAVLYNKYFKNQSASRRVGSDYISVTGGKISDYDGLIKTYSAEIGWDWRLLASLIYQESRFNPQIRSWAGAYGLMQLMPVTASRFGASRSSSPEVQIRAGVKYIQWLDKRYRDSVPDANERVKFILAAYNAGQGHVDDAMRLASSHGKDPYVWEDNVDFFILNKSNPEYYQSEAVKHGRLRGVETYNYVNEVIKRYEMYQKVVP